MSNYPPSQPPGGSNPPPPPGGSYPPPPPGGPYPSSSPGGGYPPPPGGYPQGAPPPGYGAPPPKKSKALFWILGGCAGIIVIGAIAFFVLSYVVYNKAKKVASEIQDRPALAAAKALTAFNPDVDVVSTDDEKGTITIRDKKTGETITITADDANKGKLSFKKNGQDAGSIELKAGENSGSLEFKSNEGSAKFGAGISDQAPDWLPAYPGAKVQWDYSVKNKDTHSGTYHFTTSDAADRVVSFYDEQFKKAGMKVATTTFQQASGRATILSMQDGTSKRSGTVNVTAQSGGVNLVSVVFASQE